MRIRRFFLFGFLIALVIVVLFWRNSSEEHREPDQEAKGGELEEQPLASEYGSNAGFSASPTPAPIVDFLSWVHPGDRASLSFMEYRKGFALKWIDPVTGELTVSPYSYSAICIKLVASYLLEKSDDGFNWNDYLQRSQLTVDGRPWTDSGPEILADELGLATGLKIFNVSTGEIIHEDERRNAVGPFLICWSVPLPPGQHDIHFRADTTAGRTFSYAWSFEITWR